MREGGREALRRGVHHAAVVKVILLQRVARGGVHPGGPVRARPGAVGEDLRGAVAGSHLPRGGGEGRDGVRRPRGQRRAEPVEEQVLGAEPHGVRDGAGCEVLGQEA